MASAVIFLSIDEEVQGNDNDAAQRANPADDVQDQSIQSPTPPTPPPQLDIPSTSQEALDSCTALTRRVENLEHDKVAQDLEIIKLKTRVKKLEKANKVKALKLRILRKVGTSQRIESFADTDIEDASNQGRIIAELDRDTGVALMDDEGTKKKVKDAQVADDEQVITAASTPVCAASIIIPAAELKVPAATITAVPVRVVAASTRQRKGVVIRDPKKESSAKTPIETKFKDKGKGIMVEEPKSMKKKQHVKMDEEYAKKLHEELN
nr:hypothetical protein [Tanacetum cinerariifolium]